MKVYDAKMENGYLDLMLRNKCKLSIPIGDILFLEGASKSEIENFELLKGSKIYWPDLDEEIVINNIKNKFFASHKVHLVDQVRSQHLKSIGRGVGFSPAYCGTYIYLRDNIKITTKVDEVTCKTCIRSINSKSRKVGHRISYYISSGENDHVAAPNGALWIHPITKRVRD